MRMGLTVLLCIVIVFVAAAILCHVIALATQYWLKSSSSIQSDFLNIGLFEACFHGYTHMHDKPPREYDGCHQLDSDYYSTIRDWLVPCKCTFVLLGLSAPPPHTHTHTVAIASVSRAVCLCHGGLYNLSLDYYRGHTAECEARHRSPNLPASLGSETDAIPRITQCK